MREVLPSQYSNEEICTRNIFVQPVSSAQISHHLTFELVTKQGLSAGLLVLPMIPVCISETSSGQRVSYYGDGERCLGAAPRGCDDCVSNGIAST